MKTYPNLLPKAATVAALLLYSLTADADITSYTNSAGGNWETAANWSAGAPANGEDVLITNIPGKTVAISGSTPTSALTVNSVTIGAAVLSGNPNILKFGASQTSPLHIINDFVLQSGGAVIVDSANSFQVDGYTLVGVTSPPGSPNNSSTLTINNGLSQLTYLVIGTSTNSVGMLNLNGGTISIPQGNLFVADNSYSTGIVSVAGGTLDMEGSGMILGAYGLGQLNLSSGLAKIPSIQIGNGGGSRGVINLSGGVMIVPHWITIGNNFGAAPCFVTVGTNSSLYVTNVTHNAFVDVAANSTLTLDGGLMQLDNLILTNGGSFTNLSGTLLFTQPFQVENGGSVTVSGGTIGTAASFTLGANTGSTGFLSIENGGTLIVTNANSVLGIGNDGTLTNGNGVGHASISAGTLMANTILLGSSAGGSGDLTVSDTGHVIINGGLSANDLTVSNGIVEVIAGPPPVGEDPMLNNAMVGGYLHDGAMHVYGGSVSSPIIKLGVTTGNTGTVTINGGSVTAGVFGAGNDGTLTGGSGVGHASISAGTLTANTVLLGSSAGGSGDLTVSGTGHVTVNGGLNMNDLTVSNGIVEVIAGPLPAGEDPVLANAMVGGYLHDGALNLYGGTVTTPILKLGVTSGKTGTLTMTGGTLTVQSNLVLGDCQAAATGLATLSGGTMYVTNTTHTAVLNVRNGTFTLKAGATLVVDTLILTNSCGHFVNLGGTLVTNNAPILGASLDADGDGQSNAAETAAGTDPLNPASLFQMTGITVSNQDVRVYWTTSGGHSYVVQTNGSLGGSGFHDLSPTIAIPGTGSGVTNYLHPNALTNRATFYRVWLSQ